MEIQIAAAKVNKYATSESGDTLEVIERPNGGVSVVLADGQTSGRGAKAVSQLVVRKVIGLLAEGGLMAYTSTSEVYGDPLVSPQPESYRGYVDCTGPRSSARDRWATGSRTCSRPADFPSR